MNLDVIKMVPPLPAKYKDDAATCSASRPVLTIAVASRTRGQIWPLADVGKRVTQKHEVLNNICAKRCIRDGSISTARTSRSAVSIEILNISTSSDAVIGAARLSRRIQRGFIKFHIPRGK
jgi:hypothetical protein